MPGETAQVGLRNKGGDLSLDVTATVVDPRGSTAKATRALRGAEWTYLVYGRDFGGANTGIAGSYTVIWHRGGDFLACDGFKVTAAG